MTGAAVLILTNICQLLLLPFEDRETEAQRGGAT